MEKKSHGFSPIIIDIVMNCGLSPPARKRIKFSFEDCEVCYVQALGLYFMARRLQLY